MEIAKALLTISSLVGARKAIRAAQNFELNDALGLLGLERRVRWHERIVPSLTLVAVSAAVGAGAALLLAPTSGPELRNRISSRVSSRAAGLKERAKEVKERARERAGQLEHEMRHEPPPMHHS